MDDPFGDNLALEAARQAIVLLKNEANLLPLDRAKVKRLALVGRNSTTRKYLYCYTLLLAKRH